MVRFIWGEEFFSILQAFRVLWLYGRFGGGKTALSVIVAATVVKAGWARNVHSNIRISFASPPPKDIRDAVIILDEAWMYLKGRGDVEAFAAFLRKRNIFLLLPSVFPVHPRLSFLRVQRLWNGYPFKIPWWIYRYDLALGRVREKGFFGVINPHESFRAFDSLAEPNEADGEALAVRLLESKTKKRKKKDDSSEFSEFAEELAEEIVREREEITERLDRIRSKLRS